MKCDVSYYQKPAIPNFTEIQHMKYSYYSVALLLTLLLFSCSSTKITSSWKAENVTTKPYRHIMVWGILKEEDRLLREKMEMHIVNDLKSMGYDAFSSMSIYGAKAFSRLSSTEIVEQFNHSGVDAVVTIVLLKKEKETIYVPAGVEFNPVNPFYQIDKYYFSIFDKIYTPGYYTTTTKYFWESNLYEVKGDKLVYSVQSKSFDPSSTETLAHENGVSILKDMLKKKVIIDRLTKVDDSR